MTNPKEDYKNRESLTPEKIQDIENKEKFGFKKPLTLEDLQKQHITTEQLLNKHNDLVKKYNSFLNLQVGCKYGKVYIIENGKKMIINEKENPCRAFTYATTIQETYLLWTKDFVHSRRELINFNKIYFKLYWHILEKPRNLHKIEKAFIHIYRQEPDPVSIGVIAEILERSKATVHEFTKKDAEDAQFLTSEEVKKLGLKEDLGIENIEKPLS